MMDHGGERGRLARARRPDHEHQAALGHYDLLEDRRQRQLLEARNVVDDGAYHHADVLLLHEHVDPKTRYARNGNGEVRLEIPGEFLPLPIVHQRMRQFA